MKKDIHPKYYNNVNVKCACGASFLVSSTKENLETEVCSKCHPFYTGKKIILDVKGKVEKFKERMLKKREKRGKVIKIKEEEKDDGKLKRVEL